MLFLALQACPKDDPTEPAPEPDAGTVPDSGPATPDVTATPDAGPNTPVDAQAWDKGEVITWDPEAVPLDETLFPLPVQSGSSN